MCLLLIAKNIHPEFKLIIAANRDEFYDRPADPAVFWKEYPLLLAGKDLQANGTWLGITQDGRFSALTNFRDLKNIKPNAPTRGMLTLDFLKGKYSPKEYYDKIKMDADTYNGFNLITGTVTDLYYYSNVSNEFLELGNGIFGLSNSLLDTPWPKVMQIKKVFGDLIEKLKTPFQILEALADNSPFHNDILPDTGIGIVLERTLSPIFVRTPVYGTRCSTAILVSNEGEISFVERTYIGDKYSDREFNFKMIK
jgi:uncharacterized protein with NRDE domain